MSMLTQRGVGAAKRRRRIALRVLGVVVVLALLAGVGYGVWWFYVREQPAATTASSCPTATATVSSTPRAAATARTTPKATPRTTAQATAKATAKTTAKTTAKPAAAITGKPVPPRRVGVNVYNATDRQGLAASVATQLRSRGFVVRRVANDPLNQTVQGPAEVRYGPKGGPYALTVMAQVEGAVEVLDRRADSSVDLVLGNAYQGLRPPAAAAAALTPKPTATTRPTGC